MAITHHWLASLADAKGKAKLLIKEKGILAGIRIARELFSAIDKDLKADFLIEDGTAVYPGDVAFYHFRKYSVYSEIRKAGTEYNAENEWYSYKYK